MEMNYENNLENLLYEFFFLSDQACQNRSFDPSKIEDLMERFEIEPNNSFASMETQMKVECEEAENFMRDAEYEMNLAMEKAMEDFRTFEAEFDRMAKEDHDNLLRVANGTKKMGNSMENSATLASKKYMEASLASAKASMKSAWKGFSVKPAKKIHPS
ncbi:hypothetical protein MKW92_005407 [Papaver armeniacum]|nr:hypothetical protein MKW92_005407 [Papaver armeniacum]